jgi:uncharacterized protein with NRDE domain
MCLILLAWRVHANYPLIVAANRDEFHARPAAPAGPWEDQPEILAGRDLEAGGTWMGISRSGRFAAVTNYRGAREPSAAESRGALVVRFLANDPAPEAYIHDVRVRGSAYSGFNLLAADGNSLWWLSNRGGEPRGLEPGIYGLGNTLLDAAEVDEAKARFKASLVAGPAVEALFGVLGPSRILNGPYGTRCSTVLLQGDKRAQYAERSFLPDGAEQETVRFDLPLAT